MKSPERRLGALVSCARFELLAAAARGSSPPQNLLLALGAITVHRWGLEAAFFQPALDRRDARIPPLWKSDRTVADC